MWLVIAVFIWVVFSCWVIMNHRTECYNKNTDTCIITLTTYMGFEGRSKSIRSVLDPLVLTGQEVVVINEWDKDCAHHVRFMKQYYPSVRFIQKMKHDHGQARSLNILIRDFLMHSRKKYWIHWEDTWVCSSKPFKIGEIVDVMDENPSVSQLQLTDDWKHYKVDHTICNKDMTILLPTHLHDKSIYEVEQIELGTWPLFSLRPSINRLSFFQRHSQDFYFMEDPHLWPLRFEWEFGRIFLRNKGTKAVSNKAYAKRLDGHKSTYAHLYTASPLTTVVQ